MRSGRLYKRHFLSLNKCIVIVFNWLIEGDGINKKGSRQKLAGQNKTIYIQDKLVRLFAKFFYIRIKAFFNYTFSHFII